MPWPPIGTTALVATLAAPAALNLVAHRLVDNTEDVSFLQKRAGQLCRSRTSVANPTPNSHGRRGLPLVSVADSSLAFVGAWTSAAQMTASAIFHQINTTHFVVIPVALVILGMVTFICFRWMSAGSRSAGESCQRQALPPRRHGGSERRHSEATAHRHRPTGVLPQLLIPPSSHERKLTLTFPSLARDVASRKWKGKVLDNAGKTIFDVILRTCLPSDPQYLGFMSEVLRLSYECKFVCTLGFVSKSPCAECHVFDINGCLCGQVRKDACDSSGISKITNYSFASPKENAGVVSVAFEGRIEDRKAKVVDGVAGTVLARTDTEQVARDRYRLDCYAPADLIVVAIAILGVERLALLSSG